MGTDEETESLRREIASLRRTVAELVKLLHEGGAFGIGRTEVERRLAAAARARGDSDEEDDAEAPALARSLAPEARARLRRLLPAIPRSLTETRRPRAPGTTMRARGDLPGESPESPRRRSPASALLGASA